MFQTQYKNCYLYLQDSVLNYHLRLQVPSSSSPLSNSTRRLKKKIVNWFGVYQHTTTYWSIRGSVVVLRLNRKLGLRIDLSRAERWHQEQSKLKMVNMTTFFGMSLGAFVFWQSMDKVHVWIALHQDEKKERMEKEAEIRRVREQLLQENKDREPLA
ncbi:hypothetical protein QVD17_21265 [Tagetes erecta]|uniref:Uncharacterized protein n=1 Tax=Tagetes erecta TaxID=13708 RepID=A0AAD8KQP1_TARER|nr:hypothetical protein QVD17_21265 [Tagetes erecta]